MTTFPLNTIDPAPAILKQHWIFRSYEERAELQVRRCRINIIHESVCVYCHADCGSHNSPGAKPKLYK